MWLFNPFTGQVQLIPVDVLSFNVTPLCHFSSSHHVTKLLSHKDLNSKTDGFFLTWCTYKWLLLCKSHLDKGQLYLFQQYYMLTLLLLSHFWWTHTLLFSNLPSTLSRFFSFAIINLCLSTSVFSWSASAFPHPPFCLCLSFSQFPSREKFISHSFNHLCSSYPWELHDSFSMVPQYSTRYVWRWELDFRLAEIINGSLISDMLKS